MHFDEIAAEGQTQQTTRPVAVLIELLSARQSLLNARLNVVTDIFSQLQAVISLYNALGGGTDKKF